MKQSLRRLPNSKLFHAASPAGDAAAYSVIGVNWMADRLYYGPRELEYIEYSEHAVQEYNELIQSFSQIPSTMEAARSEGVSREWDVYQLFAELDAPQEVFRYVDDQGQIALFSESEIEHIRNWSGSGPYPVSGIEGHHLETVRSNPYDLELASSPDNILFATKQGHLNYLHGGYTQNPTQPGYMEEHWTAGQMLDVTLEHHKEELIPGSAEMGLITVGGSVTLYTTVGLALRALQLRHDARPWVQKRSALYRTIIGTALTGGVLATAGWASTLTLDTLLAGLPGDILSTAMMDIVSINGAFAAITLTAGMITFIRNVRAGQSLELARAEFKSVMMVAAGEFLAFQALGIGAELLGGMLADTFVDALIPDPTGIVIAARVAWSLFKAGRKLYDSHQNKASFQKCLMLRSDHLYQQALLASH